MLRKVRCRSELVNDIDTFLTHEKAKMRSKSLRERERKYFLGNRKRNIFLGNRKRNIFLGNGNTGTGTGTNNFLPGTATRTEKSCSRRTLTPTPLR